MLEEFFSKFLELGTDEIVMDRLLTAMSVKDTKLRSWKSCIFLGVFVLIAAEVVARYGFGLGAPPLFVVHPTIEYMYMPNQDLVRFGNRILINSYGMRSEEIPEQKQKDEMRILVFGDSVLNGGNLTDHADLATTIAAKKLTDGGDQEFWIGNVSAGSWGPGNYLAYVKAYGFMQADMIGLLISSHDYGDDRSFEPLDKKNHPVRKPRSALIEGIERYLPRYLPATIKASANRSVTPPDDKTVEKVLGELKEFLMLAKKQGQVVVFQHLESSEVELGKLNAGGARIAALCAILDIPVVSLRSSFEHAIVKGQNPYRDNIHINELGQQLVAEALIAAFEKSQSGSARFSFD